MKKKTSLLIIIGLSVLTAAAGIFGIAAAVGTSEKNRYIENNFRHAFSELADGVSDMETALKKSALVTSPPMAGAVCAEVFGKAQTAQMALGVLPYSAYELEKTAGFINKVGDYAFALCRKAAAGNSFSPEERENLKSLAKTAEILARRLRETQQELLSGSISMAEYQAAIKAFDDGEGEAVPQSSEEGTKLTATEFPELPSLIYDGPFSEHLQTAEPKVLAGLDSVDQAGGRRAAAQFMGIRPEQVYPSGELQSKLPSLCYEMEIGESTVSVTVSRQGGIVYEMLSSRQVETSQLSAKEALEAAKKFLQRRGYESMTESYYLISNNVLTANFAYVQDGVVCYSDLIKVGIAMDNGALQSFEAEGYINAHSSRQLPAAQLSMESAKAAVPEGIEIQSGRAVLIPNEGKTELLCYEFKCGDENGKHYIIYVNAITGQQEKILLLLEDENGTLTM